MNHRPTNHLTQKFDAMLRTRQDRQCTCRKENLQLLGDLDALRSLYTIAEVSDELRTLIFEANPFQEHPAVSGVLCEAARLLIEAKQRLKDAAALTGA
jgi:hypothetical protein